MHALRPEEEIHCLVAPAAAAAPGAAADADGLLAAFRVGQATPHRQRVSDKLSGAPPIAAGAGEFAGTSGSVRSFVEVAVHLPRVTRAVPLTLRTARLGSDTFQEACCATGRVSDRVNKSTKLIVTL